MSKNRGRIIGTVIVLRRKSFRRYPQARASRKYAVVTASKVPIRFSGGYRNMDGKIYKYSYTGKNAQ